MEHVFAFALLLMISLIGSINEVAEFLFKLLFKIIGYLIIAPMLVKTQIRKVKLFIRKKPRKQEKPPPKN